MRGGDAGHEVHRVDRLDLHAHGTVFQARKRQHAVHQARQARDLAAHKRQMLLVAVVHAVLHGLHGRQHAHERGAQLMGHVVGEALLKLAVVLDLLGHLIERLAELAQVILALDAAAGGKLALLETSGSMGDSAHGSRQGPRGDETQHDGEQHGDDARNADRLERVGAERLVALREQVLRAVHPHRHRPDGLVGGAKHVDGHHLRGAGSKRHVRGIRVCRLTGSGKRRIVHGPTLGVANLHADVVERLGGRRGILQIGGRPVSLHSIGAFKRGCGGIGKLLQGRTRVVMKLLVP